MKYLKQPITEEMILHFNKRTNNHIRLVQKYCNMIEYKYPEFEGLIEQSQNHDQSKFQKPEVMPYIYITWQYKCKDNGDDYKLSDNISDKINKATNYHVKNNPHHPEYHSKQEVNLINREDRDKPPDVMVDATNMPDMDIAEMVADWLAMGEEKGTKVKDWANKNVNKRWKFTDKQVDLIYKLIDSIGIK